MRVLRAIIGWILILVGGIWTLLTGSCTAYWSYAGVTSSHDPDVSMAANGRSVAQLAMQIGFWVVLPGLVVLILGLFIRPGRPPADPTAS